MYREKFYEEGQVLQVNGTHAVVLLTNHGNCQECFARKQCNPGSLEERSLEIQATEGIRPGDWVKLEVYGSSMTAASILIYGVPLVLLLAGVWIGSHFFNDLLAGALGLALPAGYALILWLFTRRGFEHPLIIPRVVEKLHKDID